MWPSLNNAGWMALLRFGNRDLLVGGNVVHDGRPPARPINGKAIDLGCRTEAEMLHEGVVALVSRPVNDLPREISAPHHRDNPGSNRISITGRTETARR